jgi:hypothetical protein
MRSAAVPGRRMMLAGTNASAIHRLGLVNVAAPGTGARRHREGFWILKTRPRTFTSQAAWSLWTPSRGTNQAFGESADCPPLHLEIVSVRL